MPCGGKRFHVCFKQLFQAFSLVPAPQPRISTKHARLPKDFNRFPSQLGLTQMHILCHAQETKRSESKLWIHLPRDRHTEQLEIFTTSAFATLRQPMKTLLNVSFGICNALATRWHCFSWDALLAGVIHWISLQKESHKQANTLQ